MKCTTNPTIAASIKLSSIAQDAKNPTSDGTLIIIAIMRHFANNSVLEALFGRSSLSNY